MHFTSSKGNIGVARATAAFIEGGYDVAVPVCSTSPFDLIIYRNGKFTKVQVKYRTLEDNGTVHVNAQRAIITNNKVVRVPNLEVDLVCVFIPECNRCYYVPARKCPLTIRVKPVRNGQKKKVSLATNFERIP